MVQIQLPNSVKRILATCLVLAGIGAFAMIAFGVAVVNIEDENKVTSKFLELAKNTEVNFEDSLMVYTEKTRNIIGYLTKLRPSSEEDVINSISEIEKTGQDLGLDIKLETYKGPDSSAKSKDSSKKGYITYKIEFFGLQTDMNLFLKKLELLPYFIKVEEVDFRDIAYIEARDSEKPNIKLIIKLYTR